MKVLQFSPTYFGEDSVIGGGERYVAELARFMAREVEVSLVSFGNVRKSFKRDGVEHEIFPGWHFGHFGLHNPFALRHLCSIRGCDVVHIHQVCTFAGDLTVLVARGLRRRIVGTDHGGGGAWVLNRLLPVYRYYDAVVGQSDVAGRLLERDFEVPVVRIHGGVDTERFHWDGSLPRRKTVLFIGRLLPHKGVDFLVKAFRLLNLPDFSLRIVGRSRDEEYLNRLKSLAEGQPVEFVDDADDAQVVREYQTAQVTVLPSVEAEMDGGGRSELMGFTLLESQACGTPVICSETGGMSEFVDEGRTGHVVTPGSVESLAEGINRIVRRQGENPDCFEERCRCWANRFGWEHVVREHLALYTRLLRHE